jgi:hypothetical protein
MSDVTPPEPRRIIQIAPTDRSDASALWALCNDGTLWSLLDNRWLPRTPPIPQEPAP